MNRRLILIVAIIVIALVLVIMFLPAITGLLGLAPFSASMSAQWYNGDTPIGSPYAFINPGGSEITRVDITVSWRATGANIEPTTFSLTGNTKCYLNQLYPGCEKTLLDSHTFQYSGQDNMIDAATQNFAIDVLLADHMQWKDVGWNLVFEAHLDASVKDTTGKTISDDWDGSISYKITWSEISGTFSLTSTIGAGSG